MSNQFSNQLIIRALFNQASQTQYLLILNNRKEYSSKFLIHDAISIERTFDDQNTYIRWTENEQEIAITF